MLKKIFSFISFLLPRPEHEQGTFSDWQRLEFRKCDLNQRILGRFM